MTTSMRALLSPSDTFVDRHVGPSEIEIQQMLAHLGVASLEALADSTIPPSIRMKRPLKIGPARGERELIDELHATMQKNEVRRSYIGTGYYDTITPPVIQRNILENPGWYTQYTPYQAEIAQGRLEALVNFQTMVADLTGLPMSNASLLDEATAAAEAMAMARAITRKKGNGFFISVDCHPQTIEVVKTRARPLGIEVIVGDTSEIDYEKQDLFGVLIQYPNTYGLVTDRSRLAKATHDAGALLIVATDLLALTLLTPPGEWGADIAVGSAQRFGVPLGYGGPHAGFLSAKDEYRRQLPGRIIGVSKDARGRVGYRLALQTREQHIRRDKATSNICTAQVLLAIMASMYAVYHGPDGLRTIAARVRALTCALAEALRRLGHRLEDGIYFDTLHVSTSAAEARAIVARADDAQLNLRLHADGSLGISLDETTTIRDVEALITVFAKDKRLDESVDALAVAGQVELPEALRRKSEYLTHPVFHSYRSEHELLRYLHRLESRDLSLNTSMIPLGSCTMKLNGTSEMVPVTWPEIGGIHPFAPTSQTLGYRTLIDGLGKWLEEITGFSAISFQPNAGSQGEYAGLLVIRALHESNGQGGRDVCLIPVSAHGTNPASAVMAGFRVVPVACDSDGNIDIADLKAKAEKNAADLAALMITYPSTHGVFEEGIQEICRVVHDNGGQVYMDGANLNAQVGLCRPADYGADVCHLNLHKTFCIPHGGGGPGMGPIGVAAHLEPFLPGHPMLEGASSTAIGPIAAAPYGSPSILPISWVYIALMGSEGLTKATQVAILNANYMASRLSSDFDVLYTGPNGRVAHEFVVDLRPYKKSAGIEVDDVAKRLMDFGFHAPTMSWPVPGTLMIEPTESESKAELDRFCDAMLAIREEIRAIEKGQLDPKNNPLKNAPHTADVVTSDDWDRPYGREQAAYPAPWCKEHKFWPVVGRIDNAYGDRNLVCTCPPMEEYAS